MKWILTKNQFNLLIRKMASISNVKLSVGRVSGKIEFAEVSLIVRWSALEVRENMPYFLRTFLVEQDEQIDFYTMKPDGNIQWKNTQDTDDYVGYIDGQSLRPNGASSKSLKFRREFDFGDQERGNEEYIGIATIVPELRGDIRFSNLVKANLG